MSDAADKLARTRLAIIDHIHRREARHERPDNDREQDGAAGGEQWARARRGGPAGWFQAAKRAARGWWRHHPASMGVELATPLLSDYAGRKPVQFLAIAATLGAVAIVARPWRLVSVTGAVVALLKSSQLSGLVMSAMSAADYTRDEPPHR